MNGLVPKIILACVLLSYGCTSTHSGPPPADAEIVQVSLSSLPFRQPRVEVRRGAADGGWYKMQVVDLQKRLQAQNPATAPQQALNFQEHSIWGFWVGLFGATLSLVSDGQGYVPGRTTGNAMWGLGWVSWLGFYGLAQAEFDDAVGKPVTAGWQHDRSEVWTKSPGPGTGSRKSGWVWRWRLASF